MHPNVELRVLRYVVAVAEELHFTRAAQRLRIAQPSLSKQIRDLEDRLGVQLFVRTHRQVRVTEAGRVFLKEARKALEHSDRAVRLVVALRRPAGESIAIGYSPQMNLRLLTIVRNLASVRTLRLKINLISSHTPDQLEALSQGEIQAGLVTLPLKDEQITTNILIREPLTVVAPESHRLSSKSDLKARELNGLPVISFPRRLNPAFHDHLHMLFKKEGYVPNVVQEVTTEAEALYMVAEGFGISFVKLSAASAGHRGIVYRRFREPGLVQETGIVYRRNNRSSQVQSFVAILRKTIQQISGGSLSLPESQGNADPRQLNLFQIP
jgi:DNA-binding transcriptional LysR family regulator